MEGSNHVGGTVFGSREDILDDLRGSPTHTLKVSRRKPRISPKNSAVINPDDFDDAASVCSSASSEHSIKHGKKSKKTKRTYCEIHSKPDGQTKVDATSSAFPDGEVTGLSEECLSQGVTVSSKDTLVTTNGLSNAAPVCTCRKSSSKSTAKTRVKRPEPEGGLLSDPSKVHVLDEFDRVIYSDDPLFSDVEDNLVIDEQIKAESERLHKRYGDDENIFSAFQMINTNSMIKFAIIQTEIRNIKDVSLRRAESEVVSMMKRAESVAVNVQQTETGFQTASEQLQLVAKDVQTRARDTDGVCRSNGVRQNNSKSELNVSQTQSLYNQRCKMSKRQLVFTDIDVELAARDLDDSEQMISVLDDEMRACVNCNTKTRNSPSRETQREIALRELALRFKQTETGSRAAERRLSFLKNKLNKNQVDLQCEKNYKVVGAELDATVADMTSF